jgi:hypothetical protein
LESPSSSGLTATEPEKLTMAPHEPSPYRNDATSEPGASVLANTQSEGSAAASVVRSPRGENVFDWVLKVVAFVFVDGPDPVDEDDEKSLLEVLLPWPVRLLCVIGLTWAASFWGDAGVGRQLAWGLEVGGFCLTSIIAEYWLLLLLLDCLLAGLWFVPFEASEKAPHRHDFLQVVTFINRQIEHVKALVIWLLLAFTCSSVLTVQVGITAAVLLLAVPFINGIARLPLPFLGSDSTKKRDGGLYWRRRILIYIATLAGLLALALRAPSQVGQLVALLAAFAGGLVLRIVRHEVRASDVRKDQKQGAAVRLEGRREFRKRQAEAAHSADAYGPLLVIVGMVALVAFSFVQRRALARELVPPQNSKSGALNACPNAPAPLASSSIALFLMADTQTHELSGAPFPGQTELANVFARTATRPVALDMLSGIPIGHFQRAYAHFADDRRQSQLSPPLWAHLGDMADIGCHKELDRMLALLGPFSAAGPLASIAVGNHEKNFEGSFHWSPYWDTACSSGRMLPDEATAKLETSLGRFLPPSGQMVRNTAAYFNPSGATLSSVVPLGVANHQGTPRGVIGVFLDTSDGRAFDYGNPGSFGSVSALQLERAKEAVGRVRSAPGYQTPVYVLFEHVPFDELAPDSQKRLNALIAELDAQQGAVAGPNVLALFSAHTHVAANHDHCVNDRRLHEVVVGSTVDPPQQATLVEIGTDEKGILTLRSRALASVARTGQTCGAAPLAIEARECRAVASRLLKTPACHALLSTDAGDEPPRDCQEIEHEGTFALRLQAIRKYQGPLVEQRRRDLEEAQAKTLLDCVCHPNATADDKSPGEPVCRPSLHPLKDESYLSILADRSKDPAWQTELSCLAWAASAMQAHKDSDMTMAEAMRCAFDDPTMPAEQRTSVSLGAAPCD